MQLPLLVIASLLLAQNGPLPGNWDPTDPEDVARRATDPAGGNSADDPLKGPDVPAQTNTRGVRNGAAGGGQMTVTVESILRTNCNQCHGTEKQKGGLQILPVERLHEGAEKFRVIKPGDVAGSLLLQRIKLPAGHDDVMPPDGKTLSAAEIKVIEDWVKGGAKVEDARTAIAGMQAQGNRRQDVTPRAFLRGYMALKDLTTEQRRAGIAAATKARNTISAEDRKVLEEYQKFVRAIGTGGELPLDIAKRRGEIISKIAELKLVAQKAQADLWAKLNPDQQARLREALDKSKAGPQRDRQGPRRQGKDAPSKGS